MSTPDPAVRDRLHIVFDETAWWARRQRRHATHVWETPQRSRMHADYRAKTRRRNR